MLFNDFCEGQTNGLEAESSHLLEQGSMPGQSHINSDGARFSYSHPVLLLISSIDYCVRYRLKSTV
jgi:hypothetical protein